VAERSLEHRVEILEQQVEELDGVPARMSALEEHVAGLRVEFQQSRVENERAHSATRTLIGQMHAHAMTRLQGVEGTISQRFDRLEGSVDSRFDAVDRRFDRLEDWLTRRFERLESLLPPRAPEE
jgi:hypothetical protein